MGKLVSLEILPKKPSTSISGGSSLTPAIKIIKENIKLVVSESTKVLENHAPAQLLDLCPVLSQIKCRNNAIGYIAQQMCTKGYLIVPNSSEKLGMYTVLK